MYNALTNRNLAKNGLLVTSEERDLKFEIREEKSEI